MHMVQMANSLPAMFWEDALEDGTATPSSILAWRIPWREEPGRLQPMGLDRTAHLTLSLSYIRRASPLAQMIKNLPAIQETSV